MESEFGFLGWPWLKERILVLAFFSVKIPLVRMYFEFCSDERVVEKYQPQFNSCISCTSWYYLEPGEMLDCCGVRRNVPLAADQSFNKFSVDIDHGGSCVTNHPCFEIGPLKNLK